MVWLAPLPLLGQAFVPDKGEIDIGLGYQFLSVRDHVYSHGEKVDRGHIRNHTIGADVTFGLTDRAALSISLPLVMGKYVGVNPHPTYLDDGKLHANFSDFNVTFRYNLARKPLTLTPELAVIVPSHDYTTWAHSAPGRDLRQFRVGMNAGRRLDPFLPKMVIQGRYSYSFVERILGIPHNESNAAWEIDYFLSRRLTLLQLGTWQHIHGGIQWPVEFAADASRVFTPEQLPHHDQLLATRHLDMGGGLAVTASNSMILYAGAVTSLRYENGHRTFLGLNLGVYYTFKPSRDHSSPPAAPPPRR
jgi:hypothetical protein